VLKVEGASFLECGPWCLFPAYVVNLESFFDVTSCVSKKSFDDCGVLVWSGIVSRAVGELSHVYAGCFCSCAVEVPWILGVFRNTELRFEIWNHFGVIQAKDLAWQ
jgi:hypothetical protein